MITVDLETAKKLRGAGFPQVAHWFWTELQGDDAFLYGAKRDGTQPTLTPAPDLREYSAAPTAEEILDELPDRIEIDKETTRCQCGKSDIRVSYKACFLDMRKSEPTNQYIVRYIHCDEVFKFFRADTLANAAAEMWIYLKENDLLPKNTV